MAQELFYVYTKKVMDDRYYLGKYQGVILLTGLSSIIYCTDLEELHALYSYHDQRTKDDPMRIHVLSQPKPKRKRPLKRRPPRPDDVKKRISESKKDFKLSDREKHTASLLRKQEYRLGIRVPYAHWTGKKRYKETVDKVKQSEYQKNRPRSRCPYCGGMFCANMMALHHGDRCRDKIRYF